MLYLLRHCETTGQDPDAPLTRRGVEQAHALVSFFAGRELARIVSSPFARAVQSAAPLAAARGLAVARDAGLREHALSDGSLDDWRAAARAATTDPQLRFPGGESTAESTARGREVIDALLADGAPALAVTHGFLLMLLLRSFDARFGYDEWAAFSNPDVFALEPVGGPAAYRVRPLGRTSDATLPPAPVAE